MKKFKERDSVHNKSQSGRACAIDDNLVFAEKSFKASQRKSVRDEFLKRSLPKSTEQKYNKAMKNIYFFLCKTFLQIRFTTNTFKVIIFKNAHGLYGHPVYQAQFCLYIRFDSSEIIRRTNTKIGTIDHLPRVSVIKELVTS